MRPIHTFIHGLLALSLFSSLRAEEPALVANPEFAAWAKFKAGTTVTYSFQEVNVMKPARTRKVEIFKVTESEVILHAPNPEGGFKERVIPAKLAPAALPKDEVLKEKDELTLPSKAKLAAKQVKRSNENRPDDTLWISDEIPGGIVKSSTMEKPNFEVVVQVVEYQLPGEAVKTVFKTDPKDLNPNEAHPIESKPPEIAPDVKHESKPQGQKVEQKPIEPKPVEKVSEPKPMEQK